MANLELHRSSESTIRSNSHHGRGIIPAGIDQRGAAGIASSMRLGTQPPLTSSEVRNEAKTLREQVVWDLREEGYRHREIANVLGMTKQRASQIERELILRAAASKSNRERLSNSPSKTLRRTGNRRVRGIAVDDFMRRLDAINGGYEQQLHHILRSGYNRQKSHARGKDAESTLFWKVWPLIERYELRPFSFSSLVGDFACLSEQSHLPQLLSRLRRRGLLRKVGTVRIRGQNLPEIMMAQIPIEQFVAPKIEKLVAKWTRKLEQLKSAYCPNRTDRSIQSIRKELVQALMKEGRSQSEIEAVFRSGLQRKWNRHEVDRIDSDRAGRISNPVDNYIA